MRIATLFFLLILSKVGIAQTIDVGGVQVEIPTPAGFARVTPEMTAVTKLQRNFIPPTNTLLVSFISQEDVPTALDGKIPRLTRRFSVQSSKEALTHSMTSAEFSQLKQLFRAQGEQRIHQLKDKYAELFANASQEVSKQLDVNMLIDIGGVVPLPPHHESEKIFSSSMFMTSNVTLESGEDFSEVVSATSSLVYVNRRLMFLYVYGDKNDLEWTQSISKAWAESIVASNTESEIRTSSQQTSRGFNWDRVLSKGIGGAISAAFIVLLFSAIGWLFGKKGES